MPAFVIVFVIRLCTCLCDSSLRFVFVIGLCACLGDCVICDGLALRVRGVIASSLSLWFAKASLIGAGIKVEEGTNSVSLLGLCGLVIEETKNTLVIIDSKDKVRGAQNRTEP